MSWTKGAIAPSLAATGPIRARNARHAAGTTVKARHLGAPSAAARLLAKSPPKFFTRPNPN